MSEVGVIITGYRRPRAFPEILQSMVNQTVEPEHICLWQNNWRGEDTKRWPKDRQKLMAKHWADSLAAGEGQFEHIERPTNEGVWPRFWHALEMPTKYVLVLDDDTVPGTKWIENCLNTIQDHRGVLGTNGIIFPPTGKRRPYKRQGFHIPNPVAVQVDIVGHAWFFEREWIHDYKRIKPLPQRFDTAGEDYHFSYVMQQIGLGTYVPPHPEDDKQMWGSLRPKYGYGTAALWRKPGEETKKKKVHNAYLKAGWQLQRRR